VETGAAALYCPSPELATACNLVRNLGQSAAARRHLGGVRLYVEEAGNAHASVPLCALPAVGRRHYEGAFGTRAAVRTICPGQVLMRGSPPPGGQARMNRPGRDMPQAS
jgi:hypothetical protein